MFGGGRFYVFTEVLRVLLLAVPVLLVRKALQDLDALARGLSEAEHEQHALGLADVLAVAAGLDRAGAFPGVAVVHFEQVFVLDESEDRAGEEEAACSAAGTFRQLEDCVALEVAGLGVLNVDDVLYFLLSRAYVGLEHEGLVVHLVHHVEQVFVAEDHLDEAVLVEEVHVRLSQRFRPAAVHRIRARVRPVDQAVHLLDQRAQRQHVAHSPVRRGVRPGLPDDARLDEVHAFEAVVGVEYHVAFRQLLFAA